MTTEVLTPRMDLLSEQYVLVQAWKKTAAYIRYHNWFADTLALDQAAINLPRFLAKIAEKLQSPGQWENHPLRIVPAPKSQQWQVLASGKWEPVDKTETANKIRPLAHAVLEDQVVATALLLCLADRVETLQGDPRQSIDDKDKRNLVSSYGNRLFCETYGNGLRHRWGSTKLYRGFFEDYQRYLARPEVAAERLSLDKKRVAIVQTDLKSFYDMVTPSLLNQKISGLKKEKDGPEFFEMVRRVLCWEWDPKDRRDVSIYAKKVGLEDFSRVALPQGLVSAGFFSNIVLLDFDEMIRAEIGDNSLPGVVLHDMCRYVDDIRLVFEVGEKINLKEFEKNVVVWLQQILDRNTFGLKISPEKTKILMFGGDDRALVRQGRKMRQIQHDISGGFDAVKGGEILDAVRALVRTQERYSAKRDKGQGWSLTPVPDVGDETVTRFSATRFRSTYRSLRPLLDSQEDVDAKTNSHVNDWKSLRRTQADLDEDAKTFALGLIENWVEDPSNVRLLRIGLDIWPDVEVLKKVLEILGKYALHRVSSNPSRHVALYCLSEVFRAGATETGFVDDNERLPKAVDIIAYRALLKKEAISLIVIPSLPWYLKQQIFLFLSTSNLDDIPTTNFVSTPETRQHIKLIRYLKGNTRSLIDQDFATFAVLSRRSFLNKDKALMLANTTITVDRVKLIAELDPEMGRNIIETNSELAKSIPLETRRDLCLEIKKSMAGGWTSLADLVLSGSEQLRNELTLLDFAATFLASIQKENTKVEIILPNDVLVKIKRIRVDNKICSLSDLKIVDKKRPASKDTLYSPPYWSPAEDKWRFQLGFLLRFILTAQIDFTQIIRMDSWKEGMSIYRSPTSHWHQRLYSFYSGHSAFGSDWLPISDWIEHFLYALLAWPGCATPDFSEWVKQGIDETLDHIRKRILLLKKKQGRMSKTLILPLSSSWPSRKPATSRPLRACVVQTVVPDRNDFEKSISDLSLSLSLSHKTIRRKHRNHLSASLAAVEKMLYLRKTHNGSDGQLDLLILPELSVHPDDVKTHLEPFARANKTIILAGLIYEEIFKGKPLVNSALWVIPVWSAEKGLEILRRRQGKKHLAGVEKKLNKPKKRVQGFRPCQWLVGYEWTLDNRERPLWMTASICYDATDLRLAADLRSQSDLFIVPALNPDINTFDQMALALHYHMFQMVVVANNGTYGGSSAYAPYRKPYKRQIFHLHGQPQASIAFLEIEDIGEFLNRLHEKENSSLSGEKGSFQPEPSLNWKSPPAGLSTEPTDP